MEFVFIEGEEKPKMIYTPCVYAKIHEYSIYYIVDNGKDIKVVNKENKNKKK